MPQFTKLFVIGGGPIGLEAAIHAVKQGFDVTIFEKSSTIAGNVHEWAHVELFSSWSLNMSKLGREILAGMGKEMPKDDVFPTGQGLIDQYLTPLSEWLKASGRCEIRLGARVVSIGRGTLLKREDIGGKSKRPTTPFRLLVQNGAAEEELATGALFLIDASGTWGNPNWAGAGGLAALGERALVRSGRVRRGIVNAKGEEARLLCGKRVAVIGSGASAITSIHNLQAIADAGGEAGGGLTVVWICRSVATPYTRVPDDPLPQRDSLYAKGNALSEGGTSGRMKVEFYGGSHVTAFEQRDPEGQGPVIISLAKESDGELVPSETVSVDFAWSHCGFRPDNSLWTELQVHQCFATDGPMKLAAALMASAGGGGGDCLAQVSHGADTLKSPESNLLVLGMKSYGRSSAFLLKIGHDQVRDGVSALWASAQALEDSARSSRAAEDAKKARVE